MAAPLDTIVVGGGQAGLAAGYYLQRDRRSFVIVESTRELGGSWRHFYDSMTLFSPASLSALPGLPFPGSEPDRFPGREEVVEYLTSYAARFALPIRFDSRVVHVETTPSGFRLDTSDGAAFGSRTVIAATGSFGRPWMPELPGQRDFSGRILHAGEYRNPAAFVGKRVVVIGAGASAVQIAVDLAGDARVTLASRRKVKFFPIRLLGRSAIWWAHVLGYDWLPLRERAVVLDDGRHRAALAARRPGRRPMFSRFTTEGVVWSDGSEEPVDVVIFATGYRPNLGYLAGLGALDPDGEPLHRRGVSTTVPGLYYLSLQAQRTVTSPTLRGVGSDAAFIVRHIRQYLARVPSASPSRSIPSATLSQHGRST